MKKNFKFIVAAVAAIAMIGCAKDGGNINAPEEKGTPATASFRIELPKGTRAGVAATEQESLIQNAKVFLFDNTNRLETVADLTPAGDKKSATNASVLTTSGAHTIYVVANIPSDLTTWVADLKVTTTTQGGTSLNDFQTKMIDVAQGMANIATDGQFFMTGMKSHTFEAPTAAVPNPGANTVEMAIGRAVAKTAMTVDASVVQPSNGVVTAFQYVVMNNPNKMYAFGYSEGGIQKSPITGDGTTRGNYFRTPAAYVDASTVATPTKAYIPENANEAPNSHNTTALLIKGQFAPSVVYDADGKVATYTAGSTFYRVWDKNNSVWLAGFYSASPSKAAIKFAAGVPTTTDIFISTKKYGADAGNTSVPALAEYYIIDYIDGVSYWRLPLENSDKTAAAKYEVTRNDFFQVNLLSVSDCGSARDDDGDNGVLPKDPDPLNIPVNISAKITIAQWNGVTQDGHI